VAASWTDKMSWISPQHVEDASRVLQGAAIVLARAAAER
jgi:hypothetical protein